MSEKKNVTKQQEKKKTVIYLGPNIPGVVSRGTVFNNGLTPQLNAVIKELPAVNMLLVDISRASQVRMELKRAESVSSVCYAKISEYVKGRGKKG